MCASRPTRMTHGKNMDTHSFCIGPLIKYLSNDDRFCRETLTPFHRYFLSTSLGTGEPRHPPSLGEIFRGEIILFRSPMLRKSTSHSSTFSLSFLGCSFKISHDLQPSGETTPLNTSNGSSTIDQLKHPVNFAPGNQQSIPRTRHLLVPRSLR